ncbi:hypothetical protein CEP52_003055 [Fusarium oligoseptatum]|uniref:MOSC domain-containing protein n=1 Tax=Fusarium oligoseptatum TaxID=2604345 RepID=A0A428UAQ1_9HYPO|nr:hypothetical protein CEP52_003055 [Fusarium oligoseptatum]
MSYWVTVWNAIKQMGLKKGDSIGIVGIGGLGVLAIQFAKALGYQVIAVDNRDIGLRLASEVHSHLKPDAIVKFCDEEAAKQISDLTRDIGLHGAVLRPRVVYVVLGLSEQGYKFDAFNLVFREIVVKGSIFTSADEARKMLEVVGREGVRSHLTVLKLEEGEVIYDKSFIAYKAMETQHSATDLQSPLTQMLLTNSSILLVSATLIGLLALATVRLLRTRVPGRPHVVLKVEGVYVYPIKGLRGCTLDSGLVSGVAFQFDRRFCLQRVHRNPDTNEINRLETVMLMYNFNLVLFQTSLESPSGDPSDMHIVVTYTGDENTAPLSWGGNQHQLRFPAQVNCEGLSRVIINLQGSSTQAYDTGDNYAKWFGKNLGFETRLLYIRDGFRAALGTLAPHSDGAVRKKRPYHALLWSLTPARYKSGPERLVFNDITQYLVVTRESNDAVTARLDDGLHMGILKFRPNIILTGSPSAFVEDYWAELYFPDTNMRLILTSNCPRCQSITADFKTGRLASDDRGNVWKKLNRDRRVDKGFKYHPIFGRYGFCGDKNIGKHITVGQEVWVTKINKEHTHTIFARQ